MTSSILSAAPAPTGKLRFLAISAAAALTAASAAAHVQPTLYAMAELGVASAIGSFAAWFASHWQQWLASR